MNWLTNLITDVGLTRDSAVWFWSRVSALCAIVASGAVDLMGLGNWLGIHLSETQVHWIVAVAVGVLWLAGRYDASPLPGGKR